MALIATALPTLGIVKLALNWAPYRNELVSVYRVDPDGTRHEVIGSPVQLSGSDAILYDTTPPLDVDLTYEAVLTNPTVLQDSLTRTDGSGWGAPEFSTAAGNYGTNGGVAGDYFTNGTAGITRSTTTNAARNVLTPTGATYGDVRVSATHSVPVNSSGVAIRTALSTRWVDGSNQYQFNIYHQLTGLARLSIIKRVGGTESTIGSVDTTLEVGVNREFRITAQSVGTRHRMEVWSVTGQDDAVVLEVTDSTFTAPGRIAVRSNLPSGNTNILPVDVRWDNLVIVDLATLTLTSNMVNIEADPHGWIRDPLMPVNSIRLDNCKEHTFSCLGGDNMVFFQGFGDEDYESTTGVFSVRNATRPTTVAQTRKDLGTSLRFASVTLDDIRRIRSLFRSGRNLMLSLPLEYGWGLDNYGSDGFTAGDLSASRLNRVDMRKPYRLWSTSIVVADVDDSVSPGGFGSNGIAVPGATVGDLTATGMTVGDLTATGNTVLEVAQGVFS